jgi:hypothetical protein
MLKELENHACHDSNSILEPQDHFCGFISSQKATGRRRLMYEFEANLMNSFNYQYFGNLWIGTHQQKMEFIFDTGSAWTWLPNSDCPEDQCATTNRYKYLESGAYDDSGSESEVFYGVGYVKGNIVNDDISVTEDKSSTAKDVNFLSVFTTKELSGLESDGLLGLSPRVDYNTNYMNKLKNWLKPDQTVHLLVD